MQNRSHAVMAQRTESKDSRDDFPTPPWATRALLEHVLPRFGTMKTQSCLEPACGVGHMDKVLSEYFEQTSASDIFPYGYGEVADFLTAPYEIGSFDWVITNPPFNLAEEFVGRARQIVRKGGSLFWREPYSLKVLAVTSVCLAKVHLQRSPNSLSAFPWSKADSTKKRLQPQVTPGLFGVMQMSTGPKLFGYLLAENLWKELTIMIHPQVVSSRKLRKRSYST